jgi:hypothetical protein
MGRCRYFVALPFFEGLLFFKKRIKPQLQSGLV